MVQRIKAFIFDLDGTLLDSMGAWETNGSDYLSSQGISSFPENFREILKPMTLSEAAAYFISDFGLAKTPEQIVREMNAQIEKKYREEFQPKPGVRDFLERHQGRKMCIATATDRPLVELVLERLALRKYFDFIVTSAEVGNSKRHPDIFWEAIRRLQVKLEETVLFEDALHAIRTAKSIGLYTVGVQEACFEKDRAEIIRLADGYVQDLNEFTGFLSSA